MNQGDDGRRPHRWRLRWLLAAALAAGCAPLRLDTGSGGALPFNLGVAAPPAVTGAAHFSSAPIFERLPGKRGSHAPALTALPSGELLAAWYSYAGPEELDGAEIFSSRLAPDGGAWSEPVKLVSDGRTVGNPVLFSTGARVWLFYAVVPFGWSTARIEQQESADGGRTWSRPRGVGFPLGNNVRFPPVRVEGGWLLPAYDDLLPRSLFYFSANGRDWGLRSVLETGRERACLQPSVTVLSDGRLLALLRNAGGGYLWAAVSDDDGASWSDPSDSGYPNPASPAAVTRLASGRLALVFNDSPWDRRPLSIALSADDGETWTRPVVLVDGGGDYAYPAVVESPPGMVHVVYSHDRAYIGHTSVNEAWVARAILRAHPE